MALQYCVDETEETFSLNHSFSTLLSAAQLAGFFLAFSLSLDFWGRQILRAMKVPDAAESDGLLGCIAGASGIMVVARWLSGFTHAFEVPLAVLLGLGVLGAVWDIARETLKARGTSGKESQGEVSGGRACIARREWAVVSTLLAFVLGVWFCRLWPTGSLEPWLTPSADFYSWVFQAGYWMGYSEASTYGIGYQHPWIFDAFGTNILFAAFSSARGEPAWLAAPGFSIMLLAWTGSGIYGLVRRLTGFPRWLSWLSALGVTCGWFFWLLSFYGVYGQLAATPGYLLALRAALACGGTKSAWRTGFARLFFPFLYLFMCYQAGYFMFAAVCGLASVMSIRFGEGWRPEGPEDGSDGQHKVSGADECLTFPGASVLSILRLIWRAARPFLAVTAASAAVSPQTAYQVVTRTFSAAAQTDGYGLNFLDPGLFAGFPLIADGGYFGIRTDVAWTWWAVFLGAMGVLCVIALRRCVKVFPGRELAALKSLSLLFLLLLAGYLVAYGLKGDDYRVWKFVSLTALPVSFLPAALLVTAVHEAFRFKRSLPWYFCLLSATLISLPHMAYINPLGPRASIQNMRSLLPLSIVVEEALRYDRDTELVLFDFMTIERNFAAMVISQYSGIERIGFLNGVYFGGTVEDYFKHAERGAPVYSDRKYPDLFKGRTVLAPSQFTAFRYDINLMRRGGAVAYTGLERFTMNPIRRNVKIKILPPENFVGHDLIVRLRFAKDQDGMDPSCGKVTAREENSSSEHAVERSGGSDLEIRAPAKWQRAGYINLILELADLPESPRSDGHAWDRKNPPVCRYGYEAIEVYPDVAPSDSKEGGGRASP
jgi:hypothetical protein